SLTADDLVPELRVDLDLPLEAVGEDLERIVRHFEPFGIGNPSPVFRARGARLASPPRRVGSDGLRLTFDVPSGTLEGRGWGRAGHASRLPVERAHAGAFKLERNECRGVSRLQLRVADIQPTGR